MEEQLPAPRPRQALAALLDVAVFGGLAALVRSRADDRRAAAERLRWVRLLPAEFVREQLRSPGQRMLGVRTVDRRTGRPLALWRSLVLLAVHAAGQALIARLVPARTRAQERELERFNAELHAIYARHPDDHAAAEAERRALFERHPGPVTVNLWRSLAPALVVGLVERRLRRRLAPTIEVLARPR